MSIEGDSGRSGVVELADDFVIVQPSRKRSGKSWLVAVCVLIALGSSLWYYYHLSHPVIRILSEELVSNRVVLGIPVFLDSDTLAFNRHDASGGTTLVFKRLLGSGEESSLGAKPLVPLYSSFSEACAKTYDGAEYLHPVMSPGQQALAFVLRRYNTPRIAIAPVDGAPVILAYGESPSFSRDGKKIVFQRNTDGQEEIWIMNSDGSDQKSTNLKGRRPEWSPIRDEIVFESENGSGIQLANIAELGRSPKNLTERKETCAFPSFSADGRLILFSKINGLWVMKRDGSKQKQILRGNKPSGILIGRISHDGKRLAVWSGTGDEGKLVLYKIKYRGKRIPHRKIDIDKLARLVESITEPKDRTQPSAMQSEGGSLPLQEPSRAEEGEEPEKSYGYFEVQDVKPEFGVYIYIDDQNVATTPISEPIPVEPGKRTIKLENPQTGTIWEEYHDFQAGETYILPEIDLQ